MINKKFCFKKLTDTKPEVVLTNLIKKFNSRRNIKLIKYVEALSLLSHIRNEKIFKYQLIKILKTKLLNNIYNKLEDLPSTFDEINIDISEIDSLINSELSYKLIDNIAKTEININKNYKYYGIRNLFQYLLEIDLQNFEKFISETNRDDFKIIFVSILLSIFPILEDIYKNWDKATLGILQAYYANIYYNNNPHYWQFNLNKNKEINTILKTNLPNKSKFIIYLKYIIQKYHGKKFTNLLKDSEIDNLVNNLLSIDYNFTCEELFAQYPVFYSSIYLIIIDNVSDKKKQYEFASFLYEKLINCIEKNNSEYYVQYIEYANILGDLTIIMNNFDKLDKLFNQNYKQLLFPYSFCKRQDWNEKILLLLYILISIKIVYDGNDISNYLHKFKEVKGKHLTMLEKINPDIYNQIIKQLDNN